MRVLVTGANGFVGPHLVKTLLDNGHDVTATGHKGHNVLSDVDLMEIDLTDAAAVKKIDFTKIDGVIHLAGMAAVGPSFDAPMKYINVNGGIEVNLFETAMAQKAKPRFVVISSGSLYDPKSKLPLDENSPVRASSPYAVSKLLQEELAAHYGLRGFEVVVARPFNHIGPGQGEGFLIPDLAKQIVEAETSGADHIDVGNTESKRDYTDVRDICRAYLSLLEKGKPGQIYNVCTGKSVGVEEVIGMLLASSKTKGLKYKVDPARIRPVDVPDIYGSSEKLRKDTGWKPEISIEESLKDTLADWRSQLATKAN